MKSSRTSFKKLAAYGLLMQFINSSLLAVAVRTVYQGESVREVYVDFEGEAPRMSIGEVFRWIESKTDFRFTYDKRFVSEKVIRRTAVSLPVRRQSVAEVLMQVSEAGSLRFKQINDIISVNRIKKRKPGEKIIQIVIDDIDVSGKVTDENGEGLPGATVLEKGTANGTVTDVDGNYRLSSVSEGATLLFSFVGYVTREIAVNDRRVIDLQLVAETQQLEDIVVTALGIKREKNALGYTASQVDGKDFMRSQAPNLANALSGKSAGVFITNPNSIEGGSTRITIRGNTSLAGNNQPLIIVDGMPLSNPLEATGVASNRDYGSALNQIEALDIERMDILKGTAASALYGSRGANGVVLITTKKGAGSKGVQVTYTFNHKWTETYRFQDMQNEYGFGTPFQALEGKPVLGNAHPKEKHGAISAVTESGALYSTSSLFTWYGNNHSWGPRFNDQMITWWDGEQRPWSAQPDNMKIFYKTGMTTTHQLSLSNSGKFGNFRTSFTRKDNQAIINNSGFNTTNLYIGGNMKFNEQLNAEVFTTFNRREMKNPPLLGESDHAFTKLYYDLPRSYKGLEWKDYKNPDGSRKDFEGWIYDFIDRHNGWNFNENKLMQYRNQMRSSVKLNFRPVEWLSLTGSGGFDFTNEEEEDRKAFTDVVGLFGGDYRHSLQRIYESNFEFLASGQKNNVIEGLNGSLSLGTQFWGTSRYMIEGKKENQTGKSPFIYSFDNYETDPRVSDAKPKEKRYDKRIHSLFGFIDLSYKDFLFLQLTGRNDWSSTLPKSNNSYFYPSASLSFVFSEVFDIGNPLSFGKLRLAYAQTGSDTDPYQVIPTFESGSFAGSPTISTPEILPPVNLQSQRSEEIEIGTNLSFFDDRLNVDLTYYHKRSTNQILNAPLPWSSGFEKVVFNTGELELTGFEFDVSATVLINRDWKWDIGFVGSRSNNRLLSLTPGVKVYRIAELWGAYGTRMQATVGQNFGAIYGWAIKRTPEGRPILNVYKDTNGKVVGTLYAKKEEQEIIGNATPKLRGGFNTTLSWKNLSMFALVDFKIGGDVFNAQYGAALSGGVSPVTLKERNGGGLPYTYPNGDTDNIGVIMDGVVLKEGTTDQYIENTHVVHPYYKYAGYAWSDHPQPPSTHENTWVKMREISIFYRMPANVLNKISFIQSVNLGVTGRDLFYLYDTMPDNINPEGVNGVGDASYVVAGALPSTRSLALNLSLTF